MPAIPHLQPLYPLLLHLLKKPPPHLPATCMSTSPPLLIRGGMPWAAASGGETTGTPHLFSLKSLTHLSYLPITGLLCAHGLYAGHEIPHTSSVHLLLPSCCPPLASSSLENGYHISILLLSAPYTHCLMPSTSPCLLHCSEENVSMFVAGAVMNGC